MATDCIWAASFAGVILTYHAALVGSVIHEVRFSVADSALPLLLCAAETLLFLVLADAPDANGTPAGWYLTFFFWSLIAATIIWRVRAEIRDQAKVGTEDVRSASLQYVQRLTSDGRVAGTFALVAGSLWVVKAAGALDWLGAWEGIIGVAALVGLLIGLLSQERAIREIRTAVRS